jgi:DNA-binding transcriptional MerR regulator
MEKMANLKVNEVAKLLNLSHEAIRYYESKGIIQPQRETSNGYRQYSDWDIQILITSRMYRQFGFSLEETAECINLCDVDEISNYLSEKEDNIYQQIKWLQNLKKVTEEKKHLITEAMNLRGSYQIVNRPETYRIDLNHVSKIPKNPRISHWSKAMPFIFGSALFNYTNNKEIDLEHTVGFAITKNYADFLNIKETQYLKFYPSCRCIYTAYECNSKTGFSHETLTPAFQYMDKCNLPITGDIITRSILMRKIGKQYVNLSHVWIPF